jgi:SAM-dependent methyltransferase
MEPGAYTELAQLEEIHWWYRGMRGMADALLRKHLPRTHGLTILDAGCGTGGNLGALGKFGKVFGFDLSPLALEHAQRNHPGQIARASVTTLPYPSGFFDLVTSFDVLYMVEDDTAGLREFRRVVKPGGFVFLRLAAMPSLRGPHDDYVHTVRRYTAPELRQKIEGAGLRLLQISYANSLLLPMVFAVRTLQNRRGGMSSDVSEVSEPSNSILTGVLGLETAWLKMGGGFPAGVSLVAVAQRAPE